MNNNFPKQKILTFSVAAYNVESTLGETLESLITDPDVMDELEVIIVNDGSKDKTAEIAKRYEDVYPGTFRLVNKKNGGHGSTLNTSISLAHGKYWKMLDGDDWVETENLRAFVKFLEETDADLVLTPYIKVFPDHTEFVDHHVLIGSDNSDECKEVESLDQKSLCGMFAHEMAIRTDILQRNRICMTEHCFYVDTELVYFSLCHTQSVSKLNLPIYRYRLGVVGQSASLQGRLKHWQDAQRVEKRLLEYHYNRDSKCTPAVEESLHEIIFQFCIYQYQNCVLMEDRRRAEQIAADFDSWLRQFPAIYDEVGRSRLVKLLRMTKFKMFPLLKQSLAKRVL